MYCTMDNAGPFLKNIIGCCNFTEKKSRKACTILPVIFLKPNDAYKKKKQKKNSLSVPHYKLSIGSIVRRSQLLGCLDFGSKVYKVWPPTRDSSYKVTYSFCLCVHTRCLSLCSIFITFWARNTSKTVSCNHYCQMKITKFNTSKMFRGPKTANKYTCK